MKKSFLALPALVAGLLTPALADTVRKIDLPNNDLIYEPVSGRIWVTVPSSAGAIGNSVTAIDPLAGKVGKSFFIGSEPGRLVASSDGKYIYVAHTNRTLIRRFDVPNRTAGAQFALGQGYGQIVAGDMETVPGQPGSIAVVRADSGTASMVDITIYDDGVERPDKGYGCNNIEFKDGTRMYGYQTMISSFDYATFDVGAKGITRDQTYHPFAYNADIKYSDGRIYTTNGMILDAETAAPIGTFPGGEFCVDAKAHQVFCLSQVYGNATIEARDTDTFLPTGSVKISGINGYVNHIVRYGTDGLAFRTTGNQIFLVNGSLVRSYSLQVTVKRPNGAALANVPVTLNGQSSLTATTNSLGVANFPSLAPGDYDVVPSKTNFSFTPQPRSVTLPNPSGPAAPNARINLVGQRSAYGISGRVVNGKGMPVANQQLQLENNGGVAITTTTTDANGYYAFNGLASGGYLVQPSSVAGFAFDATDKGVILPTTGATAPDGRLDFQRTAVPAGAKAPSGHSS